MNYTQLATTAAPATIIYLVDISASMDKPMAGKRRIDVTFEALHAARKRLVALSTKGNSLQPRYRIALYAYSDKVYDLLGGIRTISETSHLRLTPPEPERGTNTAAAFNTAAELLQSQLPRIQDHPAPLICHLTDDRYTGEDPGPLINQIKQMRNADGAVLIENIYISNNLLFDSDARHWTGIQRRAQLSDDYANELKSWSSDLPESYRSLMVEMGFAVEQGSVMLLPGTNADLVQLGFQMSAMSGLGGKLS